MNRGEIAAEACEALKRNHGSGPANGLVYVVLVIDRHATDGAALSVEAHGPLSVIVAALASAAEHYAAGRGVALPPAGASS